MSYDFAVLTPETAGSDDRAALGAAVTVFESEDVSGGQADPRLAAFLADLEAEGAGGEDGGWVSVWPLGIGRGGIGVPTTYGDVDNNLVTLLRLAARHRLVLVDLNAEKVDWPAPGEPVGVMTGDGTRLGGLTYQRLESLLSRLPSSDPWIVLERAPQVYVQALRREDGAFQLEHRDGSADRHFRTERLDATQILTRMWAWLRRDPDWSANASWERVQF